MRTVKVIENGEEIGTANVFEDSSPQGVRSWNANVTLSNGERFTVVDLDVDDILKLSHIIRKNGKFRAISR